MVIVIGTSLFASTAFAYYGGFSGTSNYPSTEPLDADTFLGGKFKDADNSNKEYYIMHSCKLEMLSVPESLTI